MDLFRFRSAFAWSLVMTGAFALTACGGGEDDKPDTNMGGQDAATGQDTAGNPDANRPDTGGMDAGRPDTAGQDASRPDMGGMDASSPNVGPRRSCDGIRLPSPRGIHDIHDRAAGDA